MLNLSIVLIKSVSAPGPRGHWHISFGLNPARTFPYQTKDRLMPSRNMPESFKCIEPTTRLYFSSPPPSREADSKALMRAGRLKRGRVPECGIRDGFQRHKLLEQ